MNYTYTWNDPDQTSLRRNDGAVIPTDPANSDFQAFLASGETPAPYVSPTVVDGIIDLTVAKTAAADSTRSLAYAILQPTDWVVVRQAETGVEAPATTTAYRASVRTACENKVAVIDSEPDIESLKAYLRSEEYSAWPKEPSEVVTPE